MIEGGCVNTALNNTPKQKTGLWWKTLLALFLLLFSALLILSINLNSIAHALANRALNTFLVAGGILDDVDLQLANGEISLSGLTVNSPKAFGTNPLLKLNALHLNLRLSTLLSDEIAVETLTLEEVSLILVRNPQGKLSILNLTPPNDADDIKTTATDKQESLSIPSIHINSIQLDKISLLVVDQLNKTQWTGKLDLNLNVHNLYLKDLLNGDILTGEVELALSKVHLDQPNGIKGDSLLSLDELKITSKALDFSSSELSINQVFLSGLQSSISVQADGQSNLHALNQALFGAIKISKENDSIDTSPDTKNTLPTVVIEQIKIKNSVLNYRNGMITETPLTFPITNIQASVNQLRLFDQNTKAPPASATASFQLKQPNELPLAYFGALANIGPIGIGVPQINAQIRMTGLKLDTLGSLVSTTARRALGATGMDAAGALALNAKSIKLQVSVLSDEGIYYDAIKMQGPLTAPNVEMGAVLAGVYSRVSDGLFNIGRDGLSASGDIALGGFNAAKSVGGGAISIGKNLGESLFDVGAGLVTLNKGDVLKGLDGSSIGTFSLATDSFTSAGNAATGGLKSSVSELKGTSATQRWDADIAARYDSGIKHAKEALSNMPYPPVTH